MRQKIACWMLLLVLCLPLLRPVTADAIATKLRVGFVQNQAPYHFVDDTGEIVGMHIDMLNHIARRTGYEMEYFPMETGTECLRALENGDIDVVLDLTQKYPNSKWVSNALSEETVCSVTNVNADITERDTVATFQLGTLTPAISVKLETTYSYVASDQQKAVDLLLSGMADVMVGMKESVLYYMDDVENADDFVIESNYIGMVSFGLLVPENDYNLLWDLNKQISTLRASGTYDEIRQNWSYQDPATVNMKWLQRLVSALVVIVVVIGAYAVINSYVRKELKRQVDEKTFALQQANQAAMQHMAQLESESDIRKRIIRYSHLGMVLFDQEYQIKLINGSALTMAGCTRSPGDVRQAGVFGNIVRTCGAAVLGQLPESDREQVQIYEEGGKKYRYSFQHLLRSAQSWEVLLVVEDTTGEEARRYATFEREKSKLLNQLVAGIAHEIKNPLMSIKTFVELLKEQGTDPQFIEDFTHYVPAEVERINRLVEGLIGYAKPAKGPQTLLDLSGLVRETVFFAENSNHTRQITIESTIAPDHYIVANRDQIKQVLINIILNGMESMREKLVGQRERLLQLTITLTGTEEESRILIRDEGMGMTQQAIERCMDPFFTTKRAGTGLGLTLSKQYVQDNNGQLTIQSQSGEYTEICITFRRENT